MSDTTQLMLVVGCESDKEIALTAALESLEVPCVLIVPASWQPVALSTELGSEVDDEAARESTGLDPEVCRAFVQLTQARNAAALIANDAALAQAVGADGCHFDATADLTDRFNNARSYLGKTASIGAMPGATRHVAMALAETGADYVGYPVENSNDDEGLALIAWWSEIFEIPVVAFTPSDVDICRSVLQAGPPDFIALRLTDKSDLEKLAAIARLIEIEGQFPVTSKNAK